MTNKKLKEIKEIVTKWRENKCVHCGAQMEITYIGDNPSVFGCPNCTWNDSQEQNTYKAVLDIGELAGVIFFMTGAAHDQH